MDPFWPYWRAGHQRVESLSKGLKPSRQGFDAGAIGEDGA